MNQVLGPVTIIPSGLYVERAADRQLRDIIESMGRPGYILVARQMGKTNLLLNARRSLETPDLLFVYIDLSAKIDSLESYFGLLLNTAHAVHPDLFEALQLKEFPRDEYSTTSFENILRRVLQNHKGRLVFILDEIDSLANHPFSDRVFSQIRSMYFSRTNFPDYLRMTYILSGVAEPADLIKDKNVSPFNIGQKIFLNDFTESEFGLFLNNAGLIISNDVRARIYQWAGGHPRITWDICAEAERLSQTEELTATSIDKIVSTLYLAAFDRAPVDHIRTLAQTDREIRAAIKSLRANEQSEISDKVRSKLYLAGITSMQSGGTDKVVLRIKNRVIDETLSDRWLLDVEKQSKNILQLARENYEEKRFEPAVAFFDEYLSNHEIDASSVDAYRLAISYFSTRRFSKAIEWLRRYSSFYESEEIQSDVFFVIGRSQLALGNYEEAVDAFRKVLSLGHKQFLPLANGLLASSLIQLDIRANADEIRRLCAEALKLSEQTEAKSDKNANARVVALLSLAAVEEASENKSSALELLETAESEQSAVYRPIIVLNRLKLLPEGKRKLQLLDELADCVIKAAAAPQEQKLDGSISSVALSALVALRLNNRRADFDRLLAFLIESGETTTQDLPALYLSLYDLAEKSPVNKPTIFLRDLIERFKGQASATESLLSAMRTLVLTDSDSSVARSYIDALGKMSRTEVGFSDSDNIALGTLLSSALKDDNIEQLTEIDTVASHVKLHAGNASVGQIYFSYFEMRRLERLGRFTESVELARRLSRWLTSRSAQSFREEDRRTMQKAAQTVIESHSATVEVRNEFKGVGRNTKVTVIYPDGRKLETKFKMVQRDLALGNCKLVT
jgi:tetratricopeptide (TPR) repeat protein